MTDRSVLVINLFLLRARTLNYKKSSCRSYTAFAEASSTSQPVPATKTSSSSASRPPKPEKTPYTELFFEELCMKHVFSVENHFGVSRVPQVSDLWKNVLH